MYAAYTGDTHLEIGSGPNPFKFSKDKCVHYLDVNYEVLKRIQLKNKVNLNNLHYGSLTNIENYPDVKFDSVSCFNVMHCLPEPNKWQRFFYNTHSVMKSEGVLFGTSVHNDSSLSKLLNVVGIFHNKYDIMSSIESASKPFFEKIELDVHNNCFVFVLKKKKVIVEELEPDYYFNGI